MKPSVTNTINRLSPILFNRIDLWLRLLSFLVSVIFIGAAAVEYGFVIEQHEMLYINKIYNFAWWFYLLMFTLRLILEPRHRNKPVSWTKIIFAVIFYATALPKIFPNTEFMGWASVVWAFLSNKYFIIILLGIFAVTEISRGIVGFINKRTNPALLLAASFAVIIFFGTLLLLMPRSTLDNVHISVIDALFVSTSATCVTGLTPVDVAMTFSIEGQIIIALLIQIGGIGVMTITSFFALFFMGGTHLYGQFALRDMVSSDRLGSLMSTLLNILGFTFVIELCGAALIWLDVRGTMGMALDEEIFFSVFHSVSAFCNAGFSTLTGNLGNPLLLGSHNFFYLVISGLVFLGGIGFPILVNLKNIVSYRSNHFFGRVFHRQRKQTLFSHITQVNTKIVLVVSAVLILLGTTVIAVVEWNGAFAELNTGSKLVQSFFNAVVPRTAGFNSVDLAQFSLLSLLVYTFLMWVGGGSQSTAGGIKVNTFAVAVSNFWSVIRGRSNVVIFKREISTDSVRRASATIFVSLITIMLFFVALIILEPEIPAFGLLFETVSAIGTVGSSLNVTPLLGEGSKVLISVLMFVGRVGMITVIMGFVRQRSEDKFRYPKDNVIIN